MLCNHTICPPLVSLKLFWNVVTFCLTGHPCRWLGFNGSLLRWFLLDAKGKKAATLTPQWPFGNPGRDVQLPRDLLRRQMEDCAGLFWPSQKKPTKKVLMIVWFGDKGRLWSDLTRQKPSLTLLPLGAKKVPVYPPLALTALVCP